MEAVSSKPSRINYRSWITGAREGFTDLSTHVERYRAPYWQVYRPDYHRVLLDAATGAGAIVRKGQTVVGYIPEDPAVVL